MAPNANPASNLPSPPPSGPLALLTIPFIFTQDRFHGTDDFLNEAKLRGHDLKLDRLQELYEVGLLAPLYRVDDNADDELRVDIEAVGGANARVWSIDAARAGQLRDGAQEAYSDESPFEQPPG